MSRTIRRALAHMFLLVPLVACAGGGAPAPVDQASALAPQITPAPTVAPTPAPDPVATPTLGAAPPASPTPSNSVQDPGGVIEVEAKVEGLARIGAEKCKVCHKIQYESWSASAHAKRSPALDCEGCHGPGSEYKTLAVMKDPVQARAAGLVMPEQAFCAVCHKADWTEAMLAAVHSHKV